MGRGDLDSHFAFQSTFIQKLKDSPAEALQELGIEPTQDILKAIADLGPECLEKAMEASKEVAERHPSLVWP
jgi:hypothetical protein